MIYFLFSSAIVCSTLEDFISTDGTSTCVETIVGKVVPCCSDAYPVFPVYFFNYRFVMNVKYFIKRILFVLNYNVELFF